MLFTWIIGTVIAGALLASFFDDVMDWAKEKLAQLSSYIRKAKVFIRRAYGSVVVTLKHLFGEEKHEVQDLTVEEAYQLYKDGVITYQQYLDFKNGRDVHLGDVER